MRLLLLALVLVASTAFGTVEVPPASTGGGGGGGGDVAPTGDPVPADANYIAGRNPSGNLTGIRTDASGRLITGTTETNTYTVTGDGDIVDDLDVSLYKSVFIQIGDNQDPLTYSFYGSLDGTQYSLVYAWGVNANSAAVDYQTQSSFELWYIPVAFKYLRISVSNWQGIGDQPLVVIRSSMEIGTPPKMNSLFQSLITSTNSVVTNTNDLNATNWPIGYGPGSAGKRVAAMVGSNGTENAADNPIYIAPSNGDFDVVVNNFPNPVAEGHGVAASQTVRVAVGSFTAGYLFRNAHSSTNVTSAAWVELEDSTVAEINRLHIFDSSGRTLELALGGSGSEVAFAYIPPGGLDSPLDKNIPIGSRISVRAVSTTASSGELLITGLE
jgi:hypothetical protein